MIGYMDNMLDYIKCDGSFKVSVVDGKTSSLVGKWDFSYQS